jgi:hypothetical protein
MDAADASQISRYDPDGERVQVALLSAAGVSRRLALVLSLTDTTRRLALRAIRRAVGTNNETGVRLRFIEVHHGRDLANAVRSRARRSVWLGRASSRGRPRFRPDRP